MGNIIRITETQLMKVVEEMVIEQTGGKIKVENLPNANVINHIITNMSRYQQGDEDVDISFFNLLTRYYLYALGEGVLCLIYLNKYKKQIPTPITQLYSESAIESKSPTHKKIDWMKKVILQARQSPNGALIYKKILIPSGVIKYADSQYAHLYKTYIDKMYRAGYAAV